jgi:D-3-phosphoglycerate dehydrogenase
MSWCILNTLDLSGAPEACAALEAVGALTHLPAEREAVLARIGEFDAYLASAEVRIDAGFLAAAGRLRVIGSPSTGTDHMDTDAIRAAGVEVFDIARERALINSFTATAELAFGLILSLARHLPPALAAARQGDWARERFSGFQLSGKTLGILGLGRLGTISARIGQGFGMRAIAHDIREVSAPGVGMVGFEALLEEADALTIHVHLTAATRGLIGAAALARMKPTALLINTSRGAVLDEAALLAALRDGGIAGAGLDVIDGEWLTEKQDHPLIAYARESENLVISPHIGGATVESIHGARVFMARKLANYLRAASV